LRSAVAAVDNKISAALKETLYNDTCHNNLLYIQFRPHVYGINCGSLWSLGCCCISSILHLFVKFDTCFHSDFSNQMVSLGAVCRITYCMLKACQSHDVKEGGRLISGCRILDVFTAHGRIACNAERCSSHGNSLRLPVTRWYPLQMNEHRIMWSSL